MKDVQKEKPLNRVDIDKVGIRDLNYPIKVLDKNNETQSTTAKVSMFVDLPKSYRGTHMSRFIEILGEHHGLITHKELTPVLEDIKSEFNAERAHLIIEFPYFIEKESPVSEKKSIAEYNASFNAELNNKKYDFILGVEVPINTVCPCSKEISEQGAHNQRGVLKIRVRMDDFIWIEDLIAIGESCGSVPVYPLLKRDDEKFVTEKGYDNPKFVEDVIRDCTKKLRNNSKIGWFKVEMESLESIHFHNAYAMKEEGDDGEETT